MTPGLAIVMVLAGTLAAGAVLGAGTVARRRLGVILGTAQRQVGRRAAERLPGRWRQVLSDRLLAAGVDPVDLGAAVGLRVAAAGSAVGVCLVVAAATDGAVGVVVGAVAGLVVAAVPEVVLARRIEARRSTMARDLPRMLDLLVISVEAGLGLDLALARVVRAVPGRLADEFARFLAEVGAGMPRAEALRGLAVRCPLPELRAFALAMVQADAFGVAVGPLLRSQAAEIRIRQRQRIQMQAQKAPVKLLVPMVLCIFPALLVVVAGPALLSVRSLVAP